MENQTETICLSCKSVVPADAYFCPNCGKQMRDKPPSAAILKQITIYFVSLFLPPFGLWYAWKYLRASDSKSRIIGIIAVILTIASTLVTIWLAGALITSIYQSLNEISGMNFNVQ